MSLAFLAKKSWHTSNLKNVETVWVAEQKAAAEKKKLDELKKQINEERQVQELRELQAKTNTGGIKAIRKVDFMYEGPMSAQTATTEEYLMGKSYKPTDEIDEGSHPTNPPCPAFLHFPLVYFLYIGLIIFRRALLYRHLHITSLISPRNGYVLNFPPPFPPPPPPSPLLSIPPSSPSPRCSLLL
jgi:hypothetical protein